MQVIKATRVVMFDVDDTLVMWDWREYSPDGEGTIDIVNTECNVIECVLPHYRHIQLLKQFKARGHTVIVWSQGGHSWAENVVKALQLQDLVDIVMDKPTWYVDDLSAQVFLGGPIYLHPTNPLKDQRYDDGET